MNEIIKSKKAELLKRLQSHGVEKKECEEACIILVDRSGSMLDSAGSDTKIGAVKKAIPYLSAPGRFIYYSLVVFNDKADVITQPTTGFANVIAGLDFISPCGSTNFSDAVRRGLELLREIIEPKVKRMILLSDGQQNIEADVLNEVLERCIESKVFIDTLAFGEHADVETLKRISDRTGGKFQQVNSILALEQAYRKLNFNVRWIEHKQAIII